MKKLILAATVFFSTSLVSAAGGSVGFILGNPTAITGQYKISNIKSYQGGLAFSYDDSVLIYGDYLLHHPGLIKTTEPFINSLVPYIGIGIAAVVTNKDRRDDDGYFGKDDGSFGMGVRIPLGIEWFNKDPSFSVYFEIVPGISVFPETSAEFMGGLGLRYHFN